jgi:uncharacterized protein (TIGR00290 family)
MASQTNTDIVNTVLNWSSGKDAAMAYYLLLQQNKYKVTHLLTTLSAEYDRVFMHSTREKLLDMQAERMGLSLTKVKLPARPDDGVYKAAMLRELTLLQARGVTAAAYGDIFLQDLRQYREQQLAQVNMAAVFPLWQIPTHGLVEKIVAAGIEAVLVCVNEKCLGKEFLGRKIDASFLHDLPAGVDPCGENGEFHTFVYNAPFFSAPIPIVQGEVVYKKYTPASGGATWDTGFYFLDIDVAAG